MVFTVRNNKLYVPFDRYGGAQAPTGDSAHLARARARRAPRTFAITEMAKFRALPKPMIFAI